MGRLSLHDTVLPPGNQVEKGVKVEEYKFSRFDVVIGSVIAQIVAFFIVLVCAETLFKNGIRIETAKEAALALKPFAGRYCTYLLPLGWSTHPSWRSRSFPCPRRISSVKAWGGKWESIKIC